MFSQKKEFAIIIASLAIILISFIIISSNKQDYNSQKFDKYAGKLNISDISISINNQLIPSYNFKGGLYIAAEDLQLFGFEVKHTQTSTNILSPKISNIDNQYITKLSLMNENEKVYYPTTPTNINSDKIISYKTKDYTIIPASILDVLGKCTKKSDSATIYCDLDN